MLEKIKMKNLLLIYAISISIAFAGSRSIPYNIFVYEGQPIGVESQRLINANSIVQSSTEVADLAFSFYSLEFPIGGIVHLNQEAAVIWTELLNCHNNDIEQLRAAYFRRRLRCSTVRNNIRNFERNILALLETSQMVRTYDVSEDEAWGYEFIPTNTVGDTNNPFRIIKNERVLENSHVPLIPEIHPFLGQKLMEFFAHFYFEAADIIVETNGRRRGLFRGENVLTNRVRTMLRNFIGFQYPITLDNREQRDELFPLLDRILAIYELMVVSSKSCFTYGLWPNTSWRIFSHFQYNSEFPMHPLGTSNYRGLVLTQTEFAGCDQGVSDEWKNPITRYQRHIFNLSFEDASDYGRDYYHVFRKFLLTE